jgi:hypothetical protein
MKRIVLLLIGAALCVNAQVTTTDMVQIYSHVAIDSSQFATSDSVDSIGLHASGYYTWLDCKAIMLEADTSVSNDSVWRLSVNPKGSLSNHWMVIRLIPGEPFGIITRRIRSGHGTNAPLNKLKGILRF